MTFLRKHMWIGAALLIVAAGGFLAYGASYRLGFFMGSN
ncbi:hypothetical protein FHT00_000834 [Sphingomonas insulae]|nr:hypothetical protein [Sphingomonas insulae]